MRVRITMDRTGSQPALRVHDINETIPAGQTAEQRIKSYLAKHTQQIDVSKNPLEFIAVQITEDSGFSWDWRGWGHEEAIHMAHDLDEWGGLVESGIFPGYTKE